MSGIKERIETELLAMRPFQSTFNVSMAQNPELDAWFGAKEMATEILASGVTKQEYEEMGGSYLKENRFCKSLIIKVDKIIHILCLL